MASATSPAHHAIVFGASGLIGWGLVDQLLRNYPKPGTFGRVTACVNRPLSLKESAWPLEGGPELQLVDGVDLSKGDEKDLAKFLKKNVKGVEGISHVFYFVHRPEDDQEIEVETNRSMLERAVRAVESMSEKLEFVVFPSGTKEYGIHLPHRIYTPPYNESMDPLPKEHHNTIPYYAMRSVLTSLSHNKKWSWCDVRPDAVIGFTPTGSAYNLTAHWAKYLSLYASVEGKGSEVIFPGTKNAWESLFNQASSEIIGKFAVWAALHPDKTAAQSFNVADSAAPTTMRDLWPKLAEWFVLKGVGPGEASGDIPKPGEYITLHQNVLQEKGVKDNQIFKAHFLDSYGYYLTFDRHLSVEKARKAGFGEEVDEVGSWYDAFERFKGAGMMVR